MSMRKTVTYTSINKIKHNQPQCIYNNNLIREIYDTSNFKHLHTPVLHICNYVA